MQRGEGNASIRHAVLGKRRRLKERPAPGEKSLKTNPEHLSTRGSLCGKKINKNPKRKRGGVTPIGEKGNLSKQKQGTPL